MAIRKGRINCIANKDKRSEYTIVDLEQDVTIKWTKHNKKRYIELGYEFTDYGEEFVVKLLDLENNSNRRVVVNCSDCGIPVITPYRNYNKIVEKSGAYRCRKCNAPYTSQIRINNHAEDGIKYFNGKMIELGYKSLATIDDYKGCDVPMPFICPIHGTQCLSNSQLQQGCVCPECGRESRMSFFRHTPDVVSKIVASKNNDELLNPEEYINFKENNLRIRCGSCGNIFITSLSAIYNGDGHCRECGLITQGNTARKTKEELIEETTINGVCYLTNPDEYITMGYRNLKFICIDCKEIFVQSLGHYREGDGRCPKCSKKVSKGEKYIMVILEKYDVNYCFQQRFQDCRDKKPLPYDFYLPEYNCCIEFDGWQHYHMVQYDTEESFIIRKTHDRIKTKYCKDNNIKLIRIPYWEAQNLEEIICRELAIQLKDIA